MPGKKLFMRHFSRVESLIFYSVLICKNKMPSCTSYHCANVQIELEWWRFVNKSQLQKLKLSFQSFIDYHIDETSSIEWCGNIRIHRFRRKLKKMYFLFRRRSDRLVRSLSSIKTNVANKTWFGVRTSCLCCWTVTNIRPVIATTIGPLDTVVWTTLKTLRPSLIRIGVWYLRADMTVIRFWWTQQSNAPGVLLGLRYTLIIMTKSYCLIMSFETKYNFGKHFFSNHCNVIVR